MKDLIFRNTMTRLYNIGRERLQNAIEFGTWDGMKQGRPYIYSRSCYSALQDNSNIRRLAYLPLVERDEFGVYIPENILSDYLRAKEEEPENGDFWPELEEMERAIDEIEEAIAIIAENGLLDEADYLQEEEREKEIAAGEIHIDTDIPFDDCLEFICDYGWIECMDHVQYNTADYVRFVEAHKSAK
jgi:hypothetical protein